MLKRNILLTMLCLAGILMPMVYAAPAMAGTCGGIETNVIDCPGEGKDSAVGIISLVIKIVTAGVGVLAVGAVIFGAILYSTSGDNPENMKKAKNIWMNTVIGLAMFAFLAALTNFLIPGGIFG